MSIGQAYSDVLSFYEQKALESACDWLIDHAFDELKYIEKPQDVADTIVGGYLPERYLYKYTPLFFKQFAVCGIDLLLLVAEHGMAYAYGRALAQSLCSLSSTTLLFEG